MAATLAAAARRRWLMLLLLLSLLAATATAAPSASTASINTDRRRCAHKGIADLIRNSPVIVKALAAHIFTDAELLAAAAQSTATSAPATILITLTPETIYKGASLLKMVSGAAASSSIDSGASLGSSAAGVGNSNSGWVGNAAVESSFQYEG